MGKFRFKDLDESEFEEVSNEELEKTYVKEIPKDSKKKESSLSKDVELCSLCGLCKVNCPSFIASKNEVQSPRGRMTLLKNNKASITFYNCSLCGACTTACPLELDGDFRKVRAKLVRSGRETRANKKMIENIRKYGNPYGKLEEGEVPKDLYCC